MDSEAKTVQATGTGDHRGTWSQTLKLSQVIRRLRKNRVLDVVDAISQRPLPRRARMSAKQTPIRSWSSPATGSTRTWYWRARTGCNSPPPRKAVTADQVLFKPCHRERTQCGAFPCVRALRQYPRSLQHQPALGFKVRALTRWTRRQRHATLHPQHPLVMQDGLKWCSSAALWG